MPPSPQPGDPAADDGLIAFLRMKLAGEALPAAAGAHFHESDIYAADPATLTAGYQPAPARKGEGCSWFFFTHVRPKSSSDSRKKRVVGGGAGTWHSERAPRAVLDGEGNCVGHSQYFSYKRKTGKNSNERTDWYMVEFTEGQEGDHERIHGGEPVLVLCKIYKAHSGSRSSSSSRSARKRKAPEEHADATSAPVKAKRRLFDSPAPTLLPASQEQVSSGVTMVTSGLESQGEAAKFEQEACHGELGDTLDQLIFWASQSNVSDYVNFSPNPEASQEQVSSRVTMATSRLESQGEAATFEPEACHGEIGDTLDHLVFWASQSKMDSTSDNLKFSPNPEVPASQSNTNTTNPSFFMSETEMSPGNIGGTLHHLIFSPEPEALEGMIGSSSDYLKFTPEPEATQNMRITKPPSLLMAETETTFHGKISSSSDYLRFWSEPEASQDMIDSPSDYFKFSPEPEAVQNKTNTRFWPEPEATQKIGVTSEASQGMIDSPSDYLKFSPEPEAVQNKTNTRFCPEPEATQKIGVTSDYLKFLPGTEALQKESTTPPSQLMFEPEVQAPQGESETATSNRGIQMTGGCTAPSPSHCYGMTDLDDSYWRGNNNTVSCCHGVGWFGAPPTLCSTARIPINPSVCGGPGLWSC